MDLWGCKHNLCTLLRKYWVGGAEHELLVNNSPPKTAPQLEPHLRDKQMKRRIVLQLPKMCVRVRVPMCAYARVCECACVCVCVRACARSCVCVCSLMRVCVGWMWLGLGRWLSPDIWEVWFFHLDQGQLIGSVTLWKCHSVPSWTQNRRSYRPRISPN